MHSVVNTSSPVKSPLPGHAIGENDHVSENVFQYLGSNGGLNKLQPEVLIDCDGTMISLKEVSVDTLMNVCYNLHLHLYLYL